MSEFNEIDKIFQQGLEEESFEYNAHAWTKMERLLDQEKRKRRFFWLWFSALGSLAVVSFIFFYYSGQPVTPVLRKLDSQNTSPIIQNSPSSNEVQAFNNHQDSAIHFAEAINSNHKATTSTQQAPQETKSIQKNRSVKFLSNNEVLRKSTSQKQAYQTRDKNIFVDTSYAVKEVTRVNKASKTKNTQRAYQDTELLPTLSLLLTTEFPKIDGNSIPLFNPEKDEKKNEFLIGVYLSSELSSVEFATLSRNSFRFGGQAIYRFGNKFSTGLGISYIRKKYEVSEGDYIPPQGFWTRGIAPKSTDATSSILEIPLTFSYFPKGNNKNGLYSSIGVTSYLMLREKYQYHYDLPDPDLIRQWGTTNKNKHWFGIGEVSIGYQKSLTTSVSAQFGPYVHIPFTGIGHGQANLWSIGVNWKMNFLLRNHPKG